MGAVWPEALAAIPQEGALLVGLAVGLPHGAGDHLFVGERRRAPFVVGYAALVLATVACWPLLPAPYTFGFLAMSAWHFGQGDLQGRPIRRGWEWAATLSRGAVWIGLPLLGSDPRAWPVLEAMACMALPRPEGWVPVILAAHLAVLVVAMDGTERLRAVGEGAVLAAWLVFAPPLLGFAVAFALWHSAPHLRWMRGSLREPWRDLARQLLLPTLVSAVGAVALLGGLEPHLALVAIAALTLPHALWVHHLFQGRVGVQPVPAGR